MWTPCRRYGIIFNGEIYNHLELREQTSIEYRGHSDTETILHYLARKGVEASRDFNGIFAFGLVDRRTTEAVPGTRSLRREAVVLLGARWSFAFSSELRTLRAFVRRILDLDNLARIAAGCATCPRPTLSIRTSTRSGPVTSSRSISMVPSCRSASTPSYRATRRRRHRKTSRRPRRIRIPCKPAVERQLLSDVEIGVLLSGGVDSALIATSPRSMSAYKLKAFTVGFDGDEQADEIADASETARIVGMDHHEIRMGPPTSSTSSRVTAIVEEPLATTSVIPMFYLASLASRHVKVVLSGQGADEAMGGYQRYQAELLRSGLPGFAVNLQDEEPG